MSIITSIAKSSQILSAGAQNGSAENAVVEIESAGVQNTSATSKGSTRRTNSRISQSAHAEDTWVGSAAIDSKAQSATSGELSKR